METERQRAARQGDREKFLTLLKKNHLPFLIPESHTDVEFISGHLRLCLGKDADPGKRQVSLPGLPALREVPGNPRHRVETMSLIRLS